MGKVNIEKKYFSDMLLLIINYQLPLITAESNKVTLRTFICPCYGKLINGTKQKSIKDKLHL